MATRLAFYLKLDGKELGPFSRAEVQRRLTRGDLQASDLARTDRAPAFIPVAALLDPATERQLALLQNRSVQIPPNLSKAAASRLITAALEAEWQDDPITEGQIARLRCYHIPFSSETTKGEAAKLINDWLKAHPKDEARYQRWRADSGLTWLGQLLVVVLTLGGGGLGLLVGLTAIRGPNPLGVGWLVPALLVGAGLGYYKGKSLAKHFGLFR